MRFILAVVLCASCKADPGESVSSASSRFAALHCGYGALDWRFTSRLDDVTAHVANAHGSWQRCFEVRKPEECRNQYDRECLRKIGEASEADFGLRVRGEFRGARGEWQIWLYDLRDGTATTETRTCSAPCTDGHAEALYREMIERAFGQVELANQG